MPSLRAILGFSLGTSNLSVSLTKSETNVFKKKACIRADENAAGIGGQYVSISIDADRLEYPFNVQHR